MKKKPLTLMNTEDFAEAIVAAADPMYNIACDDAVFEALHAATEQMIKLRAKAGGYLVFAPYVKMIPVVMGTHKQDMLAIMSIVSGKTVKEITSEPATDFVKDFAAAFQDQLIPFFTAAGLMVKTD